MATNPLYRKLKRILLWYLASVLVLGLALSLAQAYFGSLIFAVYPGPVEFMGHSRFFTKTYVAVKWRRDPGAAGPCPFVVHLPAGDVGEEQLTEAWLLTHGWKEVPYPPVPANVKALCPGYEPVLPKVVKFGYGDLRIATQHTNGELTSVDVCVVEPGYETIAWNPGATLYSLSLDGRRITLPLSEAEMIRVMGLPADRRKDY
jgi:hypothetical protein